MSRRMCFLAQRIFMNNSLVFISKKGSEIEPDKKEACRYMGCRGEVKNEALEEIYSDCLELYKKEADYKAVYREVAITLQNGIVDFGFCKIENENLYKNLSGCNSAVIFAATAGVGVDRLIMRCSTLSAIEGMVCDCIASSGVEIWCDEVNACAVGGREAKPRFSPGYGGVSLTYQEDILDFLDAHRRLGITLNSSLMMIPKKSVTAFIGIKG